MTQDCVQIGGGVEWSSAEEWVQCIIIIRDVSEESNMGDTVSSLQHRDVRAIITGTSNKNKKDIIPRVCRQWRW